jgi:hypothetical protein
LTADTHVTARFGAKTYVLTVNNENVNAGIATGGGTGIHCGRENGGTVYHDCTPVERADQFVEISVFPYRGEPPTYTIGNLSCGAGEQNVSSDHDSGYCRYATGTTATDQTITIDWVQDQP